MNKLVAKLSQLEAIRSEKDGLEADSNQIQRKQLPFLSIIGGYNINLEKETSDFLQRGSLDSAGLLRAFENKDEAQNLSEKEKALYQIYNKNEINLCNSAEANVTIYILRKQIKNNLEMQFLQRVIQNISVFKQKPGMLTDSLISSSLFKQLNHEFYPRRTVLFNYGDQGSKYYIILKGSVFCLLPDSQLTEEQRASAIIGPPQNQSSRPFTPRTPKGSKQQQQNQQSSFQPQTQLQQKSSNENSDDNPKILKVFQSFQAKTKTQNFFQKLGLPSSLIDEIREEQSLTDEEYMKRKFPTFKAVRQLGPGESFGEIALMTSKGRTATVVLKEDTHFMSLSKDGFNKVFSMYKAKILEEQIQFLCNFFFFRELSKFSLLQLLYHFQIEVFTCKQVIYSEKDIANKIFLVKRGEIEITKKYLLKEDHPNLEVYQTNNKMLRQSNLKVIREENTIIVQKNIEGALSNNHSLKLNHKIQKRVTVSKQGPNSYFGEQEIVLNKEHRETQSQCSSLSCEIYIIDKNKLKQIIGEKEYRTMVEESRGRLEYQQQRVEQIISVKEILSEQLIQPAQKASQQNQEVPWDQLERLRQKKRNTFHYDERQQSSEKNSFQYKSEKSLLEIPHTMSTIKGSNLVSREKLSSNHISRIDEDQSVQLTPKTIFPAKSKKLILSSDKDTTLTSCATTRLQSQSKPRISFQNSFEKQSSLTHIGNGDITPFRSPITSFTTTQIPFFKNQIKQTLDSSTYLSSSKSATNILPLNIFSVTFRQKEDQQKEQENNKSKEQSEMSFDKKNNEEIKKLQEVYKLSVKRGAMLKEYSQKIMIDQLLQKPKQTLQSQLIRTKKKIGTYNLPQNDLQKSIVYFSPKSNSKLMNSSHIIPLNSPNNKNIHQRPNKLTSFQAAYLSPTNKSTILSRDLTITKIKIPLHDNPKLISQSHTNIPPLTSY